jgi:hypothetical protein
VLQAYRWLLAPLRHHQFFSLAELNEKLAKLVAELNDKPMAAPRDGSRRSLFEAVERAALKALPSEPYVLGEWTIGSTVNVDYRRHDRGLRSARLAGQGRSVSESPPVAPSSVMCLRREPIRRRRNEPQMPRGRRLKTRPCRVACCDTPATPLRPTAVYSEATEV